MRAFRRGLCLAALLALPALPALPQDFPRDWKSLETGTKRRLVLAGDSLSGENLLPDSSARQGAYARFDLSRRGPAWQGLLKLGQPCVAGASGATPERVKVCTFAYDVEISRLTPARIDGRARLPAGAIDCERCSPGELRWQSFTWVPER